MSMLGISSRIGMHAIGRDLLQWGTSESHISHNMNIYSSLHAVCRQASFLVCIGCKIAPRL